MTYTKSQNERGIAFGKNGVTVQFPTGSTVFASVITEIENLIEKATHIEQVMKPEAIPDQVKRIAKPLLSAALKGLEAARENAREVEALKTRAMTPPPAVAEAAKLYGAEIRTNFRNLSTADQAASLQNPTALQLACILEQDGALSGAHNDILDIAREQALTVFHAERSALSAGFPNEPSLERIVAIGASETDTKAASEIAVASFNAKLQSVGADEAVLQNLVAFIATATSSTPAETLSSIMAATDA
jgi:hypothetical protein